MTQQHYIINRKLNIIELASTLGNISQACRKLGISRQHFYDVKSALEEDGLDGLLEKSRNKPRIGNRVPESIEQKILEMALEHPPWGQYRVSNELLKQFGMKVSSGGIRGVWLRHGIENVALRLKRLEKWARENTNVLTESQVIALEQAKEEKQAHGEIESHHPGYLLGQDTLYVGYIKGVGKIYQQTGIDTYSNVGFAKVYSDKTSMTSADFLNDKVLPFYDEQEISLLRVITDRGTEYGYKNLEHPYQLYLHLNSIEHSRSKARHPQTNGCTEKLNQTILNEFYQVEFRRKVYKNLEEIQEDLDIFMRKYNNERTNQGKNCKGRTPMQTFLDAKNLYKDFVFEKKLEFAGHTV